MNKRHVFLLTGAVVAAAIAVVALNIGEPREEARVARGTGDPSKDPATGKRSLLPSEFPAAEKGKSADPPPPDAPPRKFAMELSPEPALSGLEIVDSTEDDRTRAGVTEQFGRGVTVARIHPDAPAAEVALEVGDVIVRAERDNISSAEDLRKAVGTREHTMITFSRQGQLLTVVLQKPFQRRAP